MYEDKLGLSFELGHKQFHLKQFLFNYVTIFTFWMLTEWKFKICTFFFLFINFFLFLPCSKSLMFVVIIVKLMKIKIYIYSKNLTHIKKNSLFLFFNIILILLFIPIIYWFIIFICLSFFFKIHYILF